MIETVVRGPLLIPAEDGTVAFYPDGALAGDAAGRLVFAGDFEQLAGACGEFRERRVRSSDGVMLPPLLDIHTHISQHPIRGRFVEGVSEDAPGGPLLAGLARNVFPAEALCNSQDHAEKVVRQFLVDTLSHGVVGGAAYMTSSAAATEIALSILPESWSVGLVLMNQNCPVNLRTDEPYLDRDIERLAKEFGRRLIVTDRFAVVVDSPLRRRASELARTFGLRTQTHLNEQPAEKRMVETSLYPQSASYTDVYLRDGLLDHQCIAAHCIQMTSAEWEVLLDTGTTVAHCPTSNYLLGSGRMPLEEVVARRIPYAIGTDMGASPTVSMLAEMKRFLTVHAGKCAAAAPSEALYRATLAPAEILGLDPMLGKLAVGRPMSFIEVRPGSDLGNGVIESLLPEDVDAPAMAVSRVTIQGKTAYESRLR